MSLFEWPEAKHIYLSPHLDDVVLSCGGLIYQQAQAGEQVAVITVFAGSPAGAVESPLVQEIHTRWVASAGGDNTADPPALRREEDRRSFAALHPGIQVIHLPLLDCIYRTHPASGAALYASSPALFLQVHADDPARAALADAPPLPGGTTLYVPLAVGNHVDHQLVRHAAEWWDTSAGRLRYYTDYPYAEIRGAVEAVADQVSGWESSLTPISEQALAAKVRAIAEHRSQISSFWSNIEKLQGAIRSYAAQAGGEVVWDRRR